MYAHTPHSFPLGWQLQKNDIYLMGPHSGTENEWFRSFWLRIHPPKIPLFLNFIRNFVFCVTVSFLVRLDHRNHVFLLQLKKKLSATSFLPRHENLNNPLPWYWPATAAIWTTYAVLDMTLDITHRKCTFSFPYSLNFLIRWNVACQMR